MEYISSLEAANKWNISPKRVQILCREGRIQGVIRIGRTWAIPGYAEKPADARTKSGKYIKQQG